jgi:membrane protein DedA with SNARE-associated domain
MGVLAIVAIGASLGAAVGYVAGHALGWHAGDEARRELDLLRAEMARIRERTLRRHARAVAAGVKGWRRKRGYAE